MKADTVEAWVGWKPNDKIAPHKGDSDLNLFFGDLMITPDQIKLMDDLDLEEKVRHVRTPEGSRRYHLPIGAPIEAAPEKPDLPGFYTTKTTRTEYRKSPQARTFFTQERQGRKAEDCKRDVVNRLTDALLADPACRKWFADKAADDRETAVTDRLSYATFPAARKRWARGDTLGDPEDAAVRRLWEKMERTDDIAALAKAARDPDPNNPLVIRQSVPPTGENDPYGWHALAGWRSDAWWRPKKDTPEQVRAHVWAHHAIAGWAGSSASDNSLALMLAVKETLGLDADVPLNPLGRHGAAQVKYGREKVLWDRAAQAIYAETQRQLTDIPLLPGQTRRYVRLSRGVGMPAKGTENSRAGDIAQVTGNVLSAWSHNIDEAEDFAVSMNTGGLHLEPQVLTAEVPVERVFSTPFSGPGCLNEREWVLLGGVDDPVQIAKMTDSSGAYKDADDDLEEKVRHVRTPEGARRYHLPIGSPIGGGAPEAPARPKLPKLGARRFSGYGWRQDSQVDTWYWDQANRRGPDELKDDVAKQIAADIVEDPEVRKILAQKAADQRARFVDEGFDDPEGTWQIDDVAGEAITRLQTQYYERTGKRPTRETLMEAARSDSPDNPLVIYQKAGGERAAAEGSGMYGRWTGPMKGWEEDAWWDPLGQGPHHRKDPLAVAAYDEADAAVAGWASSSSSERSITMMLAVRETLGVPEAAPLNPRAMERADRAKERYAREKPLWDAIVSAIYHETQDQLAAGHITQVRVSRGVHNPMKGTETVSEGETVTITPNALTAWTHLGEIAVDFSQNAGMGNDPQIITATVPAARVFSTPLSGPGCLNECEWVLLGGVDDEVTIVLNSVLRKDAIIKHEGGVTLQFNPPVEIEVEEKVRHVRTPEGSRRFHLPIGAPIPHVGVREAQRITQHIRGGGVTYHPTSTPHHPKKGFSLATPHRGRVFDSIDAMTSDDVRSFVDDNWDTFQADEHLHVGGWLDPDTGKVWLDVSEVLDDREEAIAVGRSRGELGIFDLGNPDLDAANIRIPYKTRPPFGPAHDAWDEPGVVLKEE